MATVKTALKIVINVEKRFFHVIRMIVVLFRQIKSNSVLRVLANSNQRGQN